MNNIDSISKSVQIFEDQGIPYALLHTTSVYPTPYDKIRLGALNSLEKEFPNAVIGLSDHSLGIYTCLASVALGASILEKHFTSTKSWQGPDIPISITPTELRELISGSEAIFQSLGGSKTILPEEKPTIDFPYSSVVTISDIKMGDSITSENIWVKRPGTGEIPAKDFTKILGKKAIVDIKKNVQLKPDMIE